MDQLERFSRLVLLIQEAALAPELWSGVVSAIVAEVDGAEGILFSPALPPSAGGFWASRSIPPSSMEHYASYYFPKDIWRNCVPGSFHRTGFAYSDERYVSAQAMRSSEFYNDFLRPLGIGRLLSGLVIAEQTPADIHLSIFRPLDRGGFPESQVAWLRRLMPHIRVALVTQRTLGAGEQAAATGEAALHSLSTPTLIVEEDATLHFVNAAAERLLETGDGLRAVKGRLVGSTPASTAALHALIARMFKPAEPSQPPAPLRLPRPSRRRALACFAQPLSPATSLAGLSGPRKGVLFVRDPEEIRGVEPAVLARLHDLSGAEAELAALLVKGLTLREAAQRRGVTYETARSQLRSVLMKTGCKKQTDLISLLLGHHPV